MIEIRKQSNTTGIIKNQKPLYPQKTNNFFSESYKPKYFEQKHVRFLPNIVTQQQQQQKNTNVQAQQKKSILEQTNETIMFCELKNQEKYKQKRQIPLKNNQNSGKNDVLKKYDQDFKSYINSIKQFINHQGQKQPIKHKRSSSVTVGQKISHIHNNNTKILNNQNNNNINDSSNKNSKYSPQQNKNSNNNNKQIRNNVRIRSGSFNYGAQKKPLIKLIQEQKLNTNDSNQQNHNSSTRELVQLISKTENIKIKNNNNNNNYFRNHNDSVQKLYCEEDSDESLSQSNCHPDCIENCQYFKQERKEKISKLTLETVNRFEDYNSKYDF